MPQKPAPAVWPPVHAQLHETHATVTIGGRTVVVDDGDTEHLRRGITGTIAATASALARSLPAVVTEGENRWGILVHPDGTVEEHAAATSQAPPREPTVTVEEVVQAASAPRPATAFEPIPVTGPTPLPVQSAPAALAPVVDVAPLLPAANDHQVDAATAEEPHANVLQPPQAGRHSFIAIATRSRPATEGIRGQLNRFGLQLQPGAAEQQRRHDEGAVSRHWPGPRTIAVVNGKGGAGKTPTTVMLSAMLARYGGAGVLAWDNNQTRGTLGWRTITGGHEGTLLDLLPNVDQLLGTSAQSANLARFVHHQPADKFDVLRSQPMGLASENRITTDDVSAIHRVAAKYYRVVIMDSGNDESDPLWLRMIELADQLVVATTTRDDHAEAGALLLEALSQRDERSARLARDAVAIVNQADPKATRDDVRHVVDGYASLTRAVVPIPFDQSMVDGHLQTATLRPATSTAWLRAAAAVAEGL